MEDKIPLDIGLTASSHVPSRIMDLIMEMVLVPTAAFTGFYYGDVSEHGDVMILTEQPRHQLCENCKQLIVDVVQALDIHHLAALLNNLDQYEQDNGYP